MGVRLFWFVFGECGCQHVGAVLVAAVTQWDKVAEFLDGSVDVPRLGEAGQGKRALLGLPVVVDILGLVIRWSPCASPA